MTESDTNSSNSGVSYSQDSSILVPVVKMQDSSSDSGAFRTNITALKKHKSIHASFIYLKKELKLEKFKRKTQIDSLLKKCKSKAFRTIHEALRNCLRVKLTRLPQPFITNIKIDFNKICLNKTILEIYREYNIIQSVDDYVEKGYVLDDKLQIFKNFLALTFKDVFDSYVTSKQYIKDYHHIKKREGEAFAILFNFISKIFVQYYLKSKGNRHKGKKINKKRIDNKKPKIEENKAVLVEACIVEVKSPVKIFPFEIKKEFKNSAKKEVSLGMDIC
jgi:hypothetical protein